MSIGFFEICLKILNNDLKHFKLCAVLVLLPILTAFVLVMWVIKPMYAATAIVTPPASESGSMSAISSMMGIPSGMASVLGLSSESDDENVVWTILNSWEMHNMVLEEFDLKNHYEFKGNFHADLLKEFRRHFGIEVNEEDMFKLYFEDVDYKLAAKVIWFMLAKADSAFNVFKTTQARQSRLYFQGRIDSCLYKLDSLLIDFNKFQVEHNIYEPNAQLEATIKYLGELQAMREEVGIEMNFEKLNRGESRHYEELTKRYQGMSNAVNSALSGKHSEIGMLELKKTPELYTEYARRESEIRVQEGLYKILRQQSEQMRMEEAKMLTNLHVLEAPWENDKKISPRRGLILMFTAFVSFLFVTLLSNFIEFMRAESERKSGTFAEWDFFCRRLCFWRRKR